MYVCMCMYLYVCIYMYVSVCMYLYVCIICMHACISQENMFRLRIQASTHALNVSGVSLLV